jgi:hypothetical protein
MDTTGKKYKSCREGIYIVMPVDKGEGTYNPPTRRGNN